MIPSFRSSHQKLRLTSATMPASTKIVVVSVQTSRSTAMAFSKPVSRCSRVSPCRCPWPTIGASRCGSYADPHSRSHRHPETHPSHEAHAWSALRRSPSPPPHVTAASGGMPTNVACGEKKRKDSEKYTKKTRTDDTIHSGKCAISTPQGR